MQPGLIQPVLIQPVLIQPVLIQPIPSYSAAFKARVSAPFLT